MEIEAVGLPQPTFLTTARKDLGTYSNIAAVCICPAFLKKKAGCVFIYPIIACASYKAVWIEAIIQSPKEESSLSHNF